MVRRAFLDKKEPVRVEDMMGNAGRAVLRGTLSLVLTASLMPVQGMAAIAEELGERAQDQLIAEVSDELAPADQGATDEAGAVTREPSTASEAAAHGESLVTARLVKEADGEVCRVDVEPEESEAHPEPLMTSFTTLEVEIVDGGQGLDLVKSCVKIAHVVPGASEADEVRSVSLVQDSEDPAKLKAQVVLEAGSNVVSVVAVDADGNETNAWMRTFVVDTVAPTATVAFGPEASVGDGTYRSRSVTVSVEDDAELASCAVQIEKDGELVAIDANQEVLLADAATYSRIVVTALDSAGNELIDEIDVDAFTINPEPVGRIAVGEEGYYRGDNAPEVAFFVSDTDFDPNATKAHVILDGKEREVDLSWREDPRTPGVWIAEHALMAGHTELISLEPHDGIGVGEAVAIATDVYCDDVAPVISLRSVSRQPDLTLTSEEGEALLVFGDVKAVYDGSEVPSTDVVITLDVADNSALDSISVGGDGKDELVDKLVSSFEPGDATGTVTITLKDDGDTVDRSTFLTLRDRSGNATTWAISKDGVVDGEGKAVHVDASLADALIDVNPYALALDLAAPSVSLRGPSNQVYTYPGETLVYTNQDQTIELDVNEANFKKLQQFRPTQGVMRVVKRLAGDDSASAETYAVGADGLDFRAFDGTHTAKMELTQPQGTEASYTITAGGDLLQDIAGNGAANQVTKAVVIDKVKPVVTILDAEGNAVADGEFSNCSGGAVLTVVVEENSLDGKAALNAGTAQNMVGIEAWGVRPNGKDEVFGKVSWVSSEDNVHTYRVTFSEEGTYAITASAVDKAGNRSDTVRVSDFTLDRTAPVISIDWQTGKAQNESYYQSPRIATITVTEANWNPDGFSDPAVVGARRAQAPVVRGAWEEAGTDEHGIPRHRATLEFTEDASYPSFTVSGFDLAGNLAEAQATEPFTLDQSIEAPAVSIQSAAPGVTGDDGVTYYNHEAKATVEIKDRNLDEDAEKTAVDPRGAGPDSGILTRSLSAKSSTDDYVTAYEATIAYGEGSYTEPIVVASDCAGNTSEYNTGATRPFVVDLTAPEIVEVVASNDPTAVGADGDGVRQFFNAATSLTIKVKDNVRLVAAEAHNDLNDPDGVYTEGLTLSQDGREGEIIVHLVDGAESAPHDSEFGRNVILTVRDLAGNERTWSISDAGTVSDDKGSSQLNASINAEGVYPLALIEDTTAPTAALSGVAAGAYYNSDQFVVAAIDEFNFAYLQRYFGDRAILHVQKQEGDAGRSLSAWDIPASQFVGSGSEWQHVVSLDEDGHYAVWIGFLDVANNASETPRIEEFTIDKSAPVMQVSFDNQDVRNGKYYNKARTATITVGEHNFDPALFSISTNGSVGQWSSSGDTHVCTVSFTEDGIYNLTVSGKDMAGNEAVAFTEPEFVIDTISPEVTFSGTAQRLGFTGEEDAYDATLQPDNAYNGVVAPRITFADDRNYDPSKTEFTLVGNKLGDVGGTYGHERFYNSNSETIQFDDFGLRGTDTAYDVNADDIYTITARAADLAGNEAEGTITFSVNRFGSNYVVSVEEGGEQVDLSERPILDEAPTITVREINVAGAASETDHAVMKEYANVTSQIEREDAGGAEGYRLDVIDRKDTDYGWAEYVYTIRRANFGSGSSSDTGDGGQGIYRVNVASDDAASNVNSTAGYWSSDAERAEASAKVGTAEFTLDEVAPVIDEVTLPGLMATGSEYQASFHVTDAITQGNLVEVYVDGERVAVTHDGQELGEDGYAGEGTFEFAVPARSFVPRKVVVKVTDYANRSVDAEAGGFYVTTMIPECAVVAGLAVVAFMLVSANARVYRRSKNEYTFEGVE